MACINLAAKIEESPRRIRDVINVFHHVKQMRKQKYVESLIISSQVNLSTYDTPSILDFPYNELYPCSLHQNILLVHRPIFQQCSYFDMQLFLSHMLLSMKAFLFSFRVIVPLILDQNYINLKNQVIKAERRVLKELGFSVHVKHPHKVNINLSHSLLCKNVLIMHWQQKKSFEISF